MEDQTLRIAPSVSKFMCHTLSAWTIKMFPGDNNGACSYQTWTSGFSCKNRCRNKVVSIDRNHFLNSSLTYEVQSEKNTHTTTQTHITWNQRYLRIEKPQWPQLTSCNKQAARQNAKLCPCSQPRMPADASYFPSTDHTPKIEANKSICT